MGDPVVHDLCRHLRHREAEAHAYEQAMKVAEERMRDPEADDVQRAVSHASPLLRKSLVEALKKDDGCEVGRLIRGMLLDWYVHDEKAAVENDVDLPAFLRKQAD